jgi:hypothetical protein
MELNGSIKPFNYGNITEEHKTAIREVISLCQLVGNSAFADMLKKKFELELPNRYDHEQHQFVKRCRELNIDVHVMGHLSDGSAEYPIISITEDVRKLENF